MVMFLLNGRGNGSSFTRQEAPGYLSTFLGFATRGAMRSGNRPLSATEGRFTEGKCSQKGPQISMKTRRIPLITRRWLSAILVLALLPFVGCTNDKASVDQPLREAIACGNLAQFKTLVAKGANVNARGRDGITPLVAAAESGNAEMVELLIAKGADINGTAKEGATAVMAAAGAGRLQVLQILIDKGANVSAEMENGTTALMFAANSGNVKETKLLVEKGADVNARRKDGATALVGAIAGGGHLDVIKVLVENGADVNPTVKYGVKALRLAEMNRQTDVVQYLKSRGAR